jgi:hypothetical protein
MAVIVYQLSDEKGGRELLGRYCNCERGDMDRFSVHIIKRSNNGVAP